MESRVYLSELFDIYGELLTEKQRDYFMEYYFDNLSLAEISENHNVSRNAIHKQIKDAESKLENFEDKLKIYKKNREIRNILKENRDVKERIEGVL